MAEYTPKDLNKLIRDLESTTEHQSGYRAALQARITAIFAELFASVLHSLQQSMGSFQEEIGRRLGDLNKELENNRNELRRSSEAANKHSKALVFATVGLVIATVFMAGIGYLQLRAAQQETQAHIEPEMSLEIVNDDGGKIIISNDGVSPLVKVVVESDTAIFLGPPFNKITSRLTTGRRIPGKEGGWWQVKELKPGEVQERPIQDVTTNAFALRKMLKEARASGQTRGLSPEAKVELRILLRFKMTVHRQVDNKQFSITRIVQLAGDSDTKPTILDAELMRYMQAGGEEVLKQF